MLKNPNLGALVKLPLKVEPDPSTGRLVATLENIPQIPFSHFNFHFKEGARAALGHPALLRHLYDQGPLHALV